MVYKVIFQGVAMSITSVVKLKRRSGVHESDIYIDKFYLFLYRVIGDETSEYGIFSVVYDNNEYPIIKEEVIDVNSINHKQICKIIYRINRAQRVFGTNYSYRDFSKRICQIPCSIFLLEII